VKNHKIIKNNHQIIKNNGTASGISRRAFGLRTGAALAGTAFGGALIGLGSSVMAATPKRGGVARIAFPDTSPNDTLDPIAVTSNIDATRCYQLYSNLVRAGSDQRPEAQLATSWEANDATTEWVFTLREGVEFHNGKTFTSADALYSIGRHLGEDTESRIKAQMSQIAEISAEGDYRIRVKLKAANAELPIIFASARAGIVPEGHTDFDNPIGTGPFKVKEFQPGISAYFERHENYFNAENVYLDAVETFAIPDPTARANALLSGEVDIAALVDAKSVDLINASPQAEVVSSRGGQWVYTAMMADRAPTDNVDFRLAMKYLQDRQRVLDGVYKGYGQIANDHPIAPSDPMYCADLPIRPYDPDKAKFHLKKAGMENATVEIYTSTTAGPGGVEQALVLQQTAAAGGVTVQVRQTPPDGYWSHTAEKYPFFGSYWNTRPTADLTYATVHMTNSAANESKYVNPHIDELMLQARATLDEAARKAIWCDLQQLISDEGGNLIPSFVDYLDGVGSHVQGFEGHPMGGLSDHYTGEGVWLDS